MRASRKQLAVAHWWHRPQTRGMDGVIAEGAIRSGKTYAMIIGFLTWSRSEFEGRNFILAGRSMGALKRNVVSPMLSILRRMGWAHAYNRSDGVITVGSNRYYLFGASTEASQDVLQGLTAAGCYADEVALFPKSFVEQMAGRCSVEGAKMWFNCNPSYPAHFFKREWVDRADELRLLHLHFDMRDNPSLSDETIARYENMFTGVFHERYIRGLWTQAEGLVWPGYRNALEDAFAGDASEWCVSIDYGTQNPFAALKWARDAGGVWHCVECYYHAGRKSGRQKTDADYVADMEAFVEGIPGRAELIVDPSAASFIAALRRSGRFRVAKADNAVADGIRDAAVAMQAGRVRISRDCSALVDELAGYVWDDKRDDAPLKRNDHACDALRYLVRTKRVARGDRPYEGVFQRSTALR